MAAGSSPADHLWCCSSSLLYRVQTGSLIYSKLVHSQSLMSLAVSPLPSLATLKGRTARARQILSQEKSNVYSQWIVKKDTEKEEHWFSCCPRAMHIGNKASLQISTFREAGPTFSTRFWAFVIIQLPSYIYYKMSRRSPTIGSHRDPNMCLDLWSRLFSEALRNLLLVTVQRTTSIRCEDRKENPCRVTDSRQ